MKESLSGPVQANRSDGIKPGIGIERKNKPTFRIVLTEKLTLTAVTMILIDDIGWITCQEMTDVFEGFTTHGDAGIDAAGPAAGAPIRTDPASAAFAPPEPAIAVAERPSRPPAAYVASPVPAVQAAFGEPLPPPAGSAVPFFFQ